MHEILVSGNYQEELFYGLIHVSTRPFGRGKRKRKEKATLL